MIDLPRLSKMCPIYAENAYFIILILDLPRTPVFAGVFLAPSKGVLPSDVATKSKSVSFVPFESINVFPNYLSCQCFILSFFKHFIPLSLIVCLDYTNELAPSEPNSSLFTSNLLRFLIVTEDIPEASEIAF
jgi:hypothetical protein